jgi:hypothetical protein
MPGAAKSKIADMLQIPAHRLPPEICGPPLDHKTGQGNPFLPERGGGETQAEEEAARKP